MLCVNKVLLKNCVCANPVEISQITSLTIDYSTIYSDADQSKHQSSASLAFVRGIHRGPVNSLHKWPVTRKMFPFDDVIMKQKQLHSLPWCSIEVFCLQIVFDEVKQILAILVWIEKIKSSWLYHFYWYANFNNKQLAYRDERVIWCIDDFIPFTHIYIAWDSSHTSYIYHKPD